MDRLGVVKADLTGVLHNVFIVTLGRMAGDFWHCAAASILSEYRLRNRSPTFPYIGVRFVVCVVVSDSDSMIEGGQKMFNYMRDIGCARVLVKVEKSPRGNMSTDAPVKTLSGTEVQGLWHAQKNGNLSFKDLLEDGSIDATQQGLGPYEDPLLIKFDVGTSVLMELTRYFGAPVAQAILAKRMSGPFDSLTPMAAIGDPEYEEAQKQLLIQGQIDEEARERLRRLVAATKKAGTDFHKSYGRQAKHVLLFNYRKVDYNAQHNGTRGILDQIKNMSALNDVAIIVVAAMEDKFLKTEIQASDTVFFLYDAPNQAPYGTRLSYRGRAQLWAYVAQELQVPLSSEASRRPQHSQPAGVLRIIGMIGGRSGSMDVASFVGMRCLSWDEPIFQVLEAMPTTKKTWPKEFQIPSGKKPKKEEKKAQDTGKDEIKPDSDSESSESRGKKRSGPEKEKQAKKPKKNREEMPPPWSSHWVTQQAHQILRLLNQRDLMAVSFLKRDPIVLVPHGSTNLRTYSLIEERDRRLIQFLNPDLVMEPPLISLGYGARPDWSYFILQKYKQVLERAHIVSNAGGPSVKVPTLDLYAVLARTEMSDDHGNPGLDPVTAEENLKTSLEPELGHKFVFEDVDAYGKLFPELDFLDLEGDSGGESASSVWGGMDEWKEYER